jgi:Rad3-related DNA helicase
MIFADQRYERSDKQGKLPQWIRNQFEAGKQSLSVDMAVRTASEFFKDMGQPFDMP